MEGAWHGVVVPVVVIDSNNEKHQVVGLLLEDSSDVSVNSPGIDGTEGGRQGVFWAFWGEHDRVPLLMKNKHELIPYHSFEMNGNQASVRGVMKYSSNNPRIDGLPAIRLDHSAVITETDGTLIREYTSASELVIEGTIEVLGAGKERGAQRCQEP